MKKFLYILVIILCVYGVNEGMELSSVNWSEVAERTHVATAVTPSEMAMRSLRGDVSVDWDTILEDAVSGDPVAQYCIALKYDKASKLAYNGRKRELQTVMAMFVLIAAQKGKYADAQADLSRYMPSLREPVDFTNAIATSGFVQQFIENIEAK